MWTDVGVKNLNVAFVWVAVIVARGEVPENDDKVFGGVIARDGLEQGAVGAVEYKGGVALDTTGKLVHTATTSSGGMVGLSSPGKGIAPFGVELDRIVIFTKNLGDSWVAEGLSVHLLTISAP